MTNPTRQASTFVEPHLIRGPSSRGWWQEVGHPLLPAHGPFRLAGRSTCTLYYPWLRNEAENPFSLPAAAGERGFGFMPHHVGLFLRPRPITLFGFHETLQHPSTEPPFYVLAPVEFMALASIGPSHIDKVRNSSLGRDGPVMSRPWLWRKAKGRRTKDRVPATTSDSTCVANTETWLNFLA